jgi:hypothetical protein
VTLHQQTAQRPLLLVAVKHDGCCKVHPHSKDEACDLERYLMLTLAGILLYVPVRLSEDSLIFVSARCIVHEQGRRGTLSLLPLSGVN